MPPTSASDSAVTNPLGSVVLVTGPEEYLRDRELESRRALVLAQEPDAEYRRLSGSELTAGSLDEAAAPSLFSAIRVTVVTKLEDTPEATFEALLEIAADPPADVALLLEHSGGNKGSGLLNKLRKSAGVVEVKTEAVKPSEFTRFAAFEVRRRGSRLAEDAAEILVQAVGQDLRALAAAAGQLTSDFPEQPITAAVVSRYFGGRAEAKTFVIGDHCMAGRLTPALVELRWALATGVSAPAVTGSLATSMRGLAKFSAAARRGRASDADLARIAGVPPWKVRSLREVARGWSETGLGDAVKAVAVADAAVKGAGADAEYALEQMVIQICAARARHRELAR